MLAELMSTFNALPGPLQTLCSSVALGTVNKLLGIGIDKLREKSPGAIFAHVCKDWQENVATDQETLAAAFEEFFVSNRTRDELDKVLRNDFINVDFDLLEQELHDAGERANCPVRGINVVRQLDLLFNDLNEWLEELPEYRTQYQIPLQRTLRALHSPEAEIPNYSLARRRYLERVRREHYCVKFAGAAEVGGPTEVGIRQVYVVPRLIAQQGPERSRTEPGREPEPIRGHELLTAHGATRKVVILGAPGSGKSTLGQWMALSLASAGNQQVPIFYRVRYLKEDLAEVSKTTKAPTLWDCLHRRASQLVGLTLPPQFIHKMDKRYGLLVFFDGLDEAADQSQAVDLISGFASSLGDSSQVVVTSRPFEYRQHLSPAEYRHYELQEFNDDEVREFIDKWRRAREEDQQEAARKADQLWNSLESREEIRALAGNALLLTMIVRVHFWLGELPDNRVELYEKCAETLLKRWAEAAGLGPGPLDRDEKNLFLARLAFQMQQEQEEKLSERGVPLQISGSDLRKRLRAFLKEEKPGASADEVVRRLQTRDAILVDYGEGQFGFIHRSFQEYFAAWWMKEELSSDEFQEFEGRRPWRETWVMAVAQLEGRRRRKALVELLLRNQARLAAECVRAGKKVERWLDVLARYLAKYYYGEHLDITAKGCVEACGDRAETLEVLEAAFDREKRDGRSLAAAVELAEQLRGAVPIAAQLLEQFFSESREFGLDRTDNMVLVDGEFWIDKFLVTNQDYECMVPQRASERDDYSKEDRQPVIYINWWEANLFCRWRGPGFHLPTEDEWYKAASWDPETGKNREYPWGDKWHQEKCNTFEGGPGKTTVVDEYPNGVGPWGCYDMAGNVFEWMVDDWEPGSPFKTVRGGSWGDDRHIAACANRDDFYYPQGRDGIVGMRCAKTSPASAAGGGGREVRFHGAGPSAKEMFRPSVRCLPRERGDKER